MAAASSRSVQRERRHARRRPRPSGWCVAATASPPFVEMAPHECARGAARAGGIERGQRLVEDPQRARTSDSRASPMRRRWPCDSTRAGSARWRATRRSSSASLDRIRASAPIAGERHQRCEVLLGGELVLRAMAGARRTRPPRGASRIERSHRLALPADLAGVGRRQPGEHAQQRRLARAVAPVDDQRLARADAKRKPREKPRKPATRGEVVRFEHRRWHPGREVEVADGARYRVGATEHTAGVGKSGAIIADAPS